jgi:hypothetical protein
MVDIIDASVLSDVIWWDLFEFLRFIGKFYT